MGCSAWKGASTSHAPTGGTPGSFVPASRASTAVGQPLVPTSGVTLRTTQPAEGSAALDQLRAPAMIATRRHGHGSALMP